MKHDNQRLRSVAAGLCAVLLGCTADAGGDTGQDPASVDPAGVGAPAGPGADVQPSEGSSRSEAAALNPVSELGSGRAQRAQAINPLQRTTALVDNTNIELRCLTSTGVCSIYNKGTQWLYIYAYAVTGPGGSALGLQTVNWLPIALNGQQARAIIGNGASDFQRFANWSSTGLGEFNMNPLPADQGRWPPQYSMPIGQIFSGAGGTMAARAAAAKFQYATNDACYTGNITIVP